MPIVNYVREHMRFIEYAADEHLTASERLLWYALMHIMNQRAQGNVWPEDFIRVNNDRLLSLCPMKLDTIASARNSLKQRGLIEFTPGDKNKKSPAYRMNYFYPQYAPPSTELDGEACYPKKSYYTGEYTGEYMGDNTGEYMGDNTGEYMGDIYYKPKDIPLNKPKETSEEDEKEEEEYACARREAAEAWKRHFGREATPAMVEKLAGWSVAHGAESGLIERAVYMAGMSGSAAPMPYALSVLADWATNGVRTVRDAEEYQVLFDQKSGRLKEIGLWPEDAADKIREFREKRRADGL